MEEKIKAIEKRVADLEGKAQNQPITIQLNITNRSDFSNYLLKCIFHYQQMMTESSRPLK